MSRRLNELHLRRGRLLERIATQRTALGREMQPVRVALHATDRVLVRVRSVSDYVKRHPGLVAFAVAALFILKVRRIWRWTRRGFLVWQTWHSVSSRLSAFGLRARS